MAHHRRHDQRGARQGVRHGLRHRRHRHHQPARDDPIWDRKSGKAIHKAIVWQDRRTADHCAALKAAGHGSVFARKTGLLLDPYFSGTKIAWLLDNVEGARRKAEAGELAFGTVDTFLLWRLTGGKVHATDATNASRTLIFDIHRGQWDEELCGLLRVPKSLLPEVRDSSGDFGKTEPSLFGASVPIKGIAGDQQAATVGQHVCTRHDQIDLWHGLLCGTQYRASPVPSRNRLLTTIAYQLNGERTYALEGAIFIAGAAVQWLRDGLKIIDTAERTGELAMRPTPISRSISFLPSSGWARPIGSRKLGARSSV